MCEFLHFKRRKEKITGPLSNDKLALAYREGVTASDDTEAVTDNYVEMANVVDRRVMHWENTANIVLEMDAKYGQSNPLNSITKLYTIAVKTKTDMRVEWALNTIKDMWASGTMVGETLSLRSLQGTSTSGGKGIIDLFNSKMDLKDHLVSEFIDTYNLWPTNVRHTMRTVLASHANYRSTCGYDGADLTFRAAWPSSAENGFQLFEAPGKI